MPFCFGVLSCEGERRESSACNPSHSGTQGSFHLLRGPSAPSPLPTGQATLIRAYKAGALSGEEEGNKSMRAAEEETRQSLLEGAPPWGQYGGRVARAGGVAVELKH